MRRMGHNLEYVRTVIKQDNSQSVIVDNLENGLYLIKVLDINGEIYTSAYVSLDDNETGYPNYWPINFLDNGGYVISAVIGLSRESLLSKQATLTIAFTPGTQITWLDSTKVNMVDIYKVN